MGSMMKNKDDLLSIILNADGPMGKTGVTANANADVKSLVIHPASTTHSQLNEKELAEQGIQLNTVRLSIGTENIDDIIEDLEEAFKAVL